VESAAKLVETKDMTELEEVGERILKVPNVRVHLLVERAVA
jgi:hypothetical protein